MYQQSLLLRYIVVLLQHVNFKHTTNIITYFYSYLHYITCNTKIGIKFELNRFSEILTNAPLLCLSDEWLSCGVFLMLYCIQMQLFNIIYTQHTHIYYLVKQQFNELTKTKKVFNFQHCFILYSNTKPVDALA